MMYILEFKIFLFKNQLLFLKKNIEYYVFHIHILMEIQKTNFVRF